MIVDLGRFSGSSAFRVIVVEESLDRIFDVGLYEVSSNTSDSGRTTGPSASRHPGST